jgi:hypothetical protein
MFALLFIDMSLDQLPQDRSITTRLSTLIDAALATLRIRKRRVASTATELTSAPPNNKLTLQNKC